MTTGTPGRHPDLDRHYLHRLTDPGDRDRLRVPGKGRAALVEDAQGKTVIVVSETRIDEIIAILRDAIVATTEDIG